MDKYVSLVLNSFIDLFHNCSFFLSICKGPITGKRELHFTSTERLKRVAVSIPVICGMLCKYRYKEVKEKTRLYIRTWLCTNSLYFFGGDRPCAHGYDFRSQH